MKMRKTLFFSALSVIVLLCVSVVFTSCVTVGIEKVQYTVLEKDGHFEIRQYKPYLVAQTQVDSDFKEAGNVAFRRLFNYISGSNRSAEKIAMTAPVNQQTASEKIAMTAPVIQQPAGDSYVISFVMPAEYTLDTIPKPTDENVVIKEVPGYKAAAIRYSGTWSQKRYEAKKAALDAFIKENDLTAIGEPIWARYDPPFQPWFLRRNEVVVPVDK